MDLDPDFLVGYGLDYDEKGRHLPGIYKRVKALEH
jgi:hypoxanthine-guanine phosphoribosyltransferase